MLRRFRWDGNTVADLFADERLSHLRQVADDVLRGIGVPRAEYRVSLLPTVLDAPDLDDRAHGHGALLGSAEVRAARTSQVTFGLALLAGEHALLFLRALVLEILSKVAVATRDLDVLPILRDLLVH